MKRDETKSERLDRNWNEILQELRVTQTGTQILTGFLLTLAFQARFTELDQVQVAMYLGLVSMAAITTALGLAPVSMHRQLFHQREKETIVRTANQIMQLTLAGVGVVLTGTVVLIFDVVISRPTGLVAGAAMLAVLAVVWLVIPGLRRRRKGNERRPARD